MMDVFLTLSTLCDFVVALKINNIFCQAQGPTLGPTQGRVKVKVMVRSWSSHGQVRSKLQLQIKSGT